MLYKALFGIVFLSQIFVISFYFPRKVSRLARGAALPEAGRPLRVYAVLNHALIGIGLVLMVVLLSLDTVTSMIPILLSIGFFFFLQVLPLALPGVQRVLSGTKPETPPGEQYPSARLFDVISRAPVITAAALFSAYVIFAAIQWIGARILNW